MLIELNIKNFALIQELSVEFGAGFNILSGETGAGKSILIDTIDYVLGGKFSKDQIRYGEEKTIVEAVFSIENDEIYDVLEELGIEKDEMLIIRRETTLHGKSLIKVNNRSIVLSQLKKVREKLLDIHGQHQNQNLLNRGTHILYVDEFYHEKIKDLLSEFEELRHVYIENIEKINELKGNEDREKLADYIKFQIEDIEKGKFKKEDFLKLIFDFTTNSVEKIKNDTSMLHKFKVEKPEGAEEVGKCPVCGNAIIEGEKGFGCTNWKNGCKFTIWKNDKFIESMGKKVTKEMVQLLLKNGKVGFRNLKSKKGTLFSAYLRYEKDEKTGYYNWKFEFIN